MEFDCVWCTLKLMRLCFLLGVVLLSSLVAAQSPPTSSADDYSGMYAFLRDGEFVQLTVEEKGKVTGFISRYGDSESDKGVFLNQFFKSGKLEGNKLVFTTEQVHGVWFEFTGSVGHGA